LKAVAKIERVVLHGELFALAMPRGSGKTMLCRAAVNWALLYGHHLFVMLIGATDRQARKLLRVDVFNVLERNAMIAQDFPEVCHPIKSLERSPQRAAKQLIDDRPTNMLWTKIELILPTVWMPDPSGALDDKGKPVLVLSPSSGANVVACGLTGGQIRGQHQDLPDGSVMRPSLVILDDPQTKGSAKSPTQTQDRIELLQGDILGMAGPAQSIAGIMPCTVIRPGDMADQILDNDKFPEWHGERTKLVYHWPANQELWDEYASIHRSALRRGDSVSATEFYAKHRVEMDAGAVVAWPAHFSPPAISAIQDAVNLKLRHGEAMFAAEFQNEPLVDRPEDDMLSVEQVAAKLNGRAEQRGDGYFWSQVPKSCNLVVCYIDVHKKLLYWTVVAFDRDFTGYVISYGTYPDQKLQWFTMRESRNTLLVAHKAQGEEAAIYAGLVALTKNILGRRWQRDDGAELRVKLCMIDTGYNKATVELFVRQSPFSGVVQAAKGFGVKATTRPLEEGGKAHEARGEGWRISSAQGKHHVPLALIDTNLFKSFLHARLAVSIGGRGCLSLWGDNDSRHRLFAEHLTSEKPIVDTARGRSVAVWDQLVGRDNHWLDCMTGCMAAGSMEGCQLLAQVVPKSRPAGPRKKVKATYFGRGN
jgi:ABC-type dipeptide/oligopeptide/nickel transport system ATPase subunit